MTDKPEWEYAGHQACKAEIERLRAALTDIANYQPAFTDPAQVAQRALEQQI